jgi:penicillin-binding protein 1A
VEGERTGARAPADCSFLRRGRARAHGRATAALSAAAVACARGARAAGASLGGAAWTLAEATCRLSQGAPGRAARRALALAAGSALLAVAGVCQSVFLDPRGLPNLDAFLQGGPPTVGIVEDARGEVLAELAREFRRPLAEHELPPVMRDALLAAEDKNFFEHRGVDLAAWPRVVSKAFAASHAAGRIRFPQGGSTLTQQLVRVAFLSDWRERENDGRLVRGSLPDRLLASVLGVTPANKIGRKLEEIRLALWLEDALAERLGSRRLAKEEILRRYAMYVYLGQGRYGFAAAAEHYLGRPLASLGPGDADLAAVLAGIPKSPSAYAPAPQNAARVLRRRNQILALMERTGSLEGAARARLQWAPLPETPPAAAPRADVATAVGQALDALSSLQDPTLGSRAVFDGRVRLRTTVDARLQRIVADALSAGLRAYEARHPGADARAQGYAVVLANEDARILAIVGGRTDAASATPRYREFNRVTRALRQAGSTMKPLVYYTALRVGYGLDSTVPDEPAWIERGGGRGAKIVSNYDGQFRGPITLRRALAESRNAATVHLARRVGLPAILQSASELGIRSPLAPYVTTALGASEVTLLELANAYRALASGRLAEPWILSGVVARDGAVIYERNVGPSLPLLDPALPFIQEALRGAVRLPGGTGGSLSALPFAVIGKTGTTNDFRDALFVGSTFGPEGVTMAVRIGFDDNRSLGEGETGGRAALPVFRETVLRAYGSRLLGRPPAFPKDLERGIDEYIVARSLTPGGVEVQVAATPGTPIVIAPAAAAGMAPEGAEASARAATPAPAPAPAPASETAAPADAAAPPAGAAPVAALADATLAAGAPLGGTRPAAALKSSAVAPRPVP